MDYIVSRKAMKSITLRVKSPHGEVRVSAPHGVSDDVIRKFVLSKSAWIENQKCAIALKPKPIEINRSRSKELLAKRLPPLIECWSARLGVTCSGWQVRFMKTRWGSCNIKTHKININLALGQFDESLLEYVVVHELAHLIERRHNKYFYSIIHNVMPDFRSREESLKEIQFQ